jgi:hypothetical protein
MPTSLRTLAALAAPRGCIKQPYGVTAKFKVNLETKDAAEAKRKAPAAMEQVQSPQSPAPQRYCTKIPTRS